MAFSRFKEIFPPEITRATFLPDKRSLIFKAHARVEAPASSARVCAFVAKVTILSSISLSSTRTKSSKSSQRMFCVNSKPIEVASPSATVLVGALLIPLLVQD